MKILNMEDRNTKKYSVYIKNSWDFKQVLCMYSHNVTDYIERAYSEGIL